MKRSIDMKTRPHAAFRLLLPIVGASVAMSVHAADPQPQRGVLDRPGTTDAGATAGGVKRSAEQGKQTTALRDVRLSRLIGTDVRNPKGEDLGDIKDLVIDSSSNQVKYAVVEFGGFLGMGEKLFAFPLTAFSQSAMDQATRTQTPARRSTGLDNDGVRGDRGPIGTDRTAGARGTGESRATAGGGGILDNDGVRGDKGPIGTDRAVVDGGARREGIGRLPSGSAVWGSSNQLVLNVDKERLEKAPGFESRRWPDFSDAGYRSQIDAYWVGSGTRPGTKAGADQQRQRASSSQAAADRQQPVGTQQQAPGSQSTAQRSPQMIKPTAWRATELLDARVVGELGKEIGEIEDVVIDGRTGKLRYTVVAFDKGWFESDKLVAVPPASLTPQGDGRVSFSGKKEQLAKAPAFDRKQWPDLNETGYRSRLDRYLGDWGGYPGPTRTSK